MRITGYRKYSTVYDWQRRIGDVNGATDGGHSIVDVLVLTTDVGMEGVAVGAAEDMERLLPVILGQDPRAVSALYDLMIAASFKMGHQGRLFSTIGAIDMALWDLKAKAAEEPLWRLLGGNSSFVPSYASALDAPLNDDELLQIYSSFQQRGFTMGKLKGGLNVDDDLRRIAIVSECLGESSVVMLDANETWHPKQAIQHIRALERHIDLGWVEEPVRRWDAEGHAIIRSSVRAPIASGENLTGLEMYKPHLTHGGVDVFQTGSVWGITHFLRVAAVAHAHSRVISAVAFHCNPLAAASAAVPNAMPLEVQNLSDPVGVSTQQCVADGGVYLPDAAGSGIVIDESQLQEPTEARLSLGEGPHVRPLRAGLRLQATKSAYEVEHA